MKNDGASQTMTNMQATFTGSYDQRLDSPELTNAQGEGKPEARTHIWDVENLSFSYAFSEATRTNFNTALSLQKQYKGSVAYQFSPKGSGIEPFKNSKGLKSPWLKAIKDFNCQPDAQQHRRASRRRPVVE